MSWWGYRKRRSSSRSQKAKREGGGIVARSKRGPFTKTWWGKRWEDGLGQLSDGFTDEGRLARGRSLARNQGVRSLEIAPGLVKAKVLSSQGAPYNVTVSVGPAPPWAAEALAEALARDASLLARLLNGELAEELADAALLFPKFYVASEFQAACNCYDFGRPCKHMAAVLYLLAEEIDADPFLMLRLRGIDREDLLARVHAAGGGAETSEAGGADAGRPEAEPLPPEPAAFWKPFHPGLLPPPGMHVPSVQAAIAKRLGPLPLWQGRDPFLATMEKLYADASRNALDAVDAARERVELEAGAGEPADELSDPS